LAEDLLENHASLIEAVTIVPSDGGVFDVRIDGKTVYSMFDTGRFPTSQEIAAALEARE